MDSVPWAEAFQKEGIAVRHWVRYLSYRPLTDRTRNGASHWTKCLHQLSMNAQASPHCVILACAIAKAHLPIESPDLASAGLDGKGLLPI